MKYPLATHSWDEKEKQAAIDVINSGMCSMGKITKEFESEFSKKTKSKYSVFCNSGSSANLLAISALLYRREGLKLNPGDEIIVPAVSWATSFYPVHQCGLKLVFVDINLHDFNISIDAIKKAITTKTKAILAVNLLGMPCDMNELLDICKNNNLILLEDNCESLGATYDGKQSGTFAEIGTFSGFFSHHINVIEGGVCTTDDEELNDILISLKAHGWIRHLPNKNKVYNKSGNVFEDTFKFVLPGYNLRPTEISSAIGLEQLKKLDSMISWRRKNAEYLQSRLKEESSLNSFKLQYSDPYNASMKSSSWFGFGFISTEHNRMKVIDHLTQHEIESRPIVAGNFTRNPVINLLNHSIVGNLSNAEIIDKQGFFVGNNGIDMTKEIDYFIDTLKQL